VLGRGAVSGVSQSRVWPRASDYDRACDVDDYVGIITVGHGEGLVLGDLPAETTWLARPWGGILARWEYADGYDAMERALADIPDVLPWEPKGDLIVVSSPLELFNSAEPGIEPVLPRMTIDLAEGTYHVGWARHTPDDRTAATLIELRRSSA
jgi:hypothetical protein